MLACRRTGQVYGDHPHFDAVLELLSCADRVHDVGPLAADLLAESTCEHARYLPCLKVVEHIALADRAQAEAFCDKCIPLVLLKSIKVSPSLSQYDPL